MKNSVERFLAIIILVFLYGCNAAPDTSEEAATVEEEMSSEAEETVEVEPVQEVEKKTELTADLYLQKMRGMQGTRLGYQVEVANRAKHNFQYLEQWYSIDVNDNDGNTYTGIYQITEKDTLLQFVSITPETDEEGGQFINYFDEPWYEFSFENNQLTEAKYINPKDDSTANPLDSLSGEWKIHLSDSIRRIMNSYFQLDSSKTQFNGRWRYSENTDSYSFSTTVKQIGSFVYGEYCANTQSRSDCGVPEQGGDPCFINGYVYSDTLRLFFQSCHAGSSGNAKMYFQNDTLVWETIYGPDGSLAPTQAKLVLD